MGRRLPGKTVDPAVPNLILPQVEFPNLEEVCDSCAAQPVIVRDVGSVAHAGVGAGPVFKVRSDEDMGRFVEGAIMVTPFTAPWLARIVPKASGIIAERGSAAGHLATIAREFRVACPGGSGGCHEDVC